jgi:hypothetical protein
VSPPCKACAHCFMEPDDDLCCGHSSAGAFGTYVRHMRKEGATCGPDGGLFEQHPLRNSDGTLKVASDR